jgi:membrane protein DedA with SNARE-associated domain
MEDLPAFLVANPWGIYACLLLAPFIQEDAAVIAAATASVSGLGAPVWLFVSVLAGLSLSDSWKYWAGRAARNYGWARKHAEKPAVQRARDRVVERLGASLMMVRFVPGTRIPFYVASGYFRAPYARFALFLVLAGTLYVGAMFALMHALGEIAGEQARIWLPVVAIALFVTVIAVQVWRARRDRAVDRAPARLEA